MKTPILTYIDYLFTPTEASIFKMFTKGKSYQYIMNKMQLSVINIDNAIKRINRKKAIIQHTLETVEVLQRKLIHSSVKLNPPLDWGRAEQMARYRNISLPFDYLVLLTQLGNGGTIGSERFFSLEESLQKAEDEWIPFYQNKKNKVYCFGIQEWNEHVIEPAIYETDNDRPNGERLIDCFYQLISTHFDYLKDSGQQEDKIEELKQHLVNTYAEMEEEELRTELYYILNHISASELERIYPSNHPINADNLKSGT